jgi:hypothetical protein
LADNRLPEFADIDLELVKDILESVDALDADLTGYSPDELFKELDGSPNDAEFKEYDESVEDEVEFITVLRAVTNGPSEHIFKPCTYIASRKVNPDDSFLEGNLLQPISFYKR